MSSRTTSLTNPFQALILRQKLDHDPMPMDACDGISEQSRFDIVTTNSSALSPRDLPPLQLKANLPLQQVSSTRCKQTSAANTVKSSPSTKTFSALVLALTALGIAHSCRAMSPIRGPLASVMMSSTALALSNLITKPSALAAVPFDLEMPRTPERAYLASPKQW